MGEESGGWRGEERGRSAGKELAEERDAAPSAAGRARCGRCHPGIAARSGSRNKTGAGEENYQASENRRN